jgi:uncharacterized protein
MRYLLDANIWLEVVLERHHAAVARQLMQFAPPGTLAVTDFSVHAIGLYLYRDRPQLFRLFLDDLIRGSVNTLHLPASSIFQVLDVIARHSLDFDDAFQLIAAERFDLKIVSFDTDFDRTPRGRMTPAQVLAELAAPQ